MKYGRIIQYAAVNRLLAIVGNKTYQEILDFLKSNKHTNSGIKTIERLAGMILHIRNHSFVPEFDFRDYAVLVTVNANKNNPDLAEFLTKYQGVDIEGVFL